MVRSVACAIEDAISQSEGDARPIICRVRPRRTHSHRAVYPNFTFAIVDEAHAAWRV